LQEAQEAAEAAQQVVAEQVDIELQLTLVSL